MNIIFATLKKILFWSYDRGTWQYDLLCVLILAFIFLAPNWIFNSSGRSTPDHAVATQQVIKGTLPSDAGRDSAGEKQKSLPDKQPEPPSDKGKD